MLARTYHESQDKPIYVIKEEFLRRAEFMMNIAVVGTGYVGLVSGTCYAESGNEVICVDIDAARIAAAQRGQGADLRAGPRRAGAAQYQGRPPQFHHRPQPKRSAQSMVSFIAVGTPMSK